jgi:hypothetical protein
MSFYDTSPPFRLFCFFSIVSQKAVYLLSLLEQTPKGE